MVRLLIAPAVGLVLAVDATAVTTEVPGGIASGRRANKTLCNHGNR